MSVDVDAVNDRLNGLVTLLKAVGVDSEKRPGGGGSSKGGGGIPDARQLDDDQIEAIIKKLQMAQSEAPQIIAALEAQAKMKKGQGGGSAHQQTQQRSSRQQQQRRHEEEEEEEDEEEEEEVVEEEEGEEEDDDDEDSFDEDANYPMVGHGCSDDVSIMSDLTTPTVVQGVSVPDEEHYRDTLPPMIVGGGHHNAPPMLIAPTKRKNLVGSVRANTLAAPRGNAVAARAGAVLKAPPQAGTTAAGAGGAAAQRRKHYNATMEKLAHEPTMTQQQQQQAAPQAVRKVKPMAPPQQQPQQPQPQQQAAAAAPKKKVVKPTTTSAAAPAPRRASVAPVVSASDWGQPQIEWGAFEAAAAAPSKSSGTARSGTPKTATTLIDDDGFLMDGSFDPFQTSDPVAPSFKSQPTYNSNNSTGGDSGKQQVRRIKKKAPSSTNPGAPMSSSFDGGFKAPMAAFEPPPPQPQSRTKTTSAAAPALNGNGSGGNLMHNSSSSGGAVGNKPRRSRRASLNM